MFEISSFYYKKPKHHTLIYLIFLAFILLLTYISIKYYTYDIKELLVINECEEEKCFLKTTLNYEEQNIIAKDTKIKYQGNNYKINEIEYSEPYLSNGVPVTDISLLTDLKEDKKIIKIEVKYHKQRIINKIKEKIIERKQYGTTK